MKNVQKGKEILRVNDTDAESFIRKGYVYVSKSALKSVKEEAPKEKSATKEKTPSKEESPKDVNKEVKKFKKGVSDKKQKH